MSVAITWTATYARIGGFNGVLRARPSSLFTAVLASQLKATTSRSTSSLLMTIPRPSTRPPPPEPISGESSIEKITR